VRRHWADLPPRGARVRLELAHISGRLPAKSDHSPAGGGLPSFFFRTNGSKVIYEKTINWTVQRPAKHMHICAGHQSAYSTMMITSGLYLAR
jgi:hypothetical protein